MSCLSSHLSLLQFNLSKGFVLRGQAQVAPPANRLEPVLGKRRGHWRVRIQGPWHLCFRFINGEAWDVGIAECEE
ncbi:type II toxin-antitoxin system RelE/ParE family toxin [Cupriavidus metallidurans]